MLWQRIEDWLVGPLGPEIRYNMRAELASQVAYGVLAAVLGFLPLILRRMGGPPLVLALYSSASYLGNVLSTFGLFLMRPGRAKRVVALSWLAARLTFLAAALVTDDIGLLILAAVFFLADQLPNPAYSAIIQSIYPPEDRGKVLAVVRLGSALPLLLLTPAVGWLLDRRGPPVVFILGGGAGLLAVLLFSRLRVDEGALHVRRMRSLGYAGEIVRGDRRFTLYLVGLVVFGLSSLIPNPLYPLVQADRLRLSYEELGWLNLVFSFARLGSYFYWGRRIDRWGSVRCLRIAFAFNVVAIMPYLWATAGWMLLPSFIAQGITNSAVDLGFISSVFQLADAQRVSEYTALQYTVIGLRGILGPLIGVGLLHLGVPQAAIFVLASGLGLAAAAILGRVGRLAAAPARAVAAG